MVQLKCLVSFLISLFLTSSASSPIRRDDLSDIRALSVQILSQVPGYPSCESTCSLFDTTSQACDEVSNIARCWCAPDDEGAMHQCSRCMLTETKKSKNETAFNSVNKGHTGYHEKCTAANGARYHDTWAPESDVPKDFGEKESHTGAIVGAVVGGVVGLALIGVVAFYLHRCTKKRKPDPVQKVEYADVSTMQYVDSPNPANPVPYLDSSTLGYNSYSPPPSSSPPLYNPANDEFPYTPPPPSATYNGKMSPNRQSTHAPWTYHMPSPDESRQTSFPSGFNTGSFVGYSEPEEPRR